MRENSKKTKRPKARDTQCCVCTFTARLLDRDRSKMFRKVHQTVKSPKGKDIAVEAWICKSLGCANDSSVLIMS